jgi:hypothetical protein
MTVGFYYCANALGRLAGTLASGALYTYAGEADFVSELLLLLLLRIVHTTHAESAGLASTSRDSCCCCHDTPPPPLTHTGANVAAGLGWCFVASLAFAIVSTFVTVLIPDDSGGLMCGSRITLVKHV